MAGMDAEAALLANRTDCEPDSELNFDALLLGGYYCHQCLPGKDGAMCDAGGECTNVQWLGYVCDNEYLVLEKGTGGLQLLTPEEEEVDHRELLLRDGVTYRFTIRTTNKVCLTDDNFDPVALPGNDSGCATLGPLLVEVTDDLPSVVSLVLDDGSSIQIRTEGNNKVDSNEESPGAVKKNTTATDSENGPNITVIVGVIVPLAVLFVALAASFLFLRRKNRTKNDSAEVNVDSREYQKESGSPARTAGSDDNSGSDKVNTSKDSSEDL